MTFWLASPSWLLKVPNSSNGGWMENIVDTYHVWIALGVCYTDVEQLYIQILKTQEAYISISEEINDLILNCLGTVATSVKGLIYSGPCK